jgi:predicted transcriptional regulator
MHQLTLRIPEELAGRLRDVARARRESVNAFAAAVLAAAVDPELADDDAARTRERLARAGLLAAEPPRSKARAPGNKELGRARRAAGRGRKLSDLVAEDRR